MEQELPPIDPVERALAVIGVYPVISREVERITKPKFREMNDLTKKIQKLARGLCKDTLTAAPKSEMNYRKMLRELSEGFDAKQVESMVAQFPAEYYQVAGAFVMKAKELVDQLQAMLPVSVYQTFSGFKNLDVSDVNIFHFQSVLDVLENPLRVFSLMATGSLLARQVKAMRLVYPTLSAAIDAALDDATVNEKVALKSYELPPTAEYGVGTWFNRPRKSRARPGNQDPAQQTKTGPSQKAKELLSPAQKASGDQL